MARETEREGSESPRDSSSTSSGSSVVDEIKAIAAYNARANLDSEKQLTLYLQSWWSRTYNKPLKDPILLSYTLEELLYEFYDKIERRAAEEERAESESVKIEEDKEQGVLDWAELEEKKELDALKARAAIEATKVTNDPTLDPDNVQWMEKQLAEAKSLYGENFGEDINDEFND